MSKVNEPVYNRVEITPINEDGHQPLVALPLATRRHYLAAGAAQDGKQRAALRIITGGRR